LARCTNAQVRAAPVTPVTVMLADCASVEMNASRSSLGAVVENDGEVTLEAELDLSVDLTWSMAIAAHAGAMAARIRNKPRARLIARLTDEIVFTFSTELIFSPHLLFGEISFYPSFQLRRRITGKSLAALVFNGSLA
jgi:hypothetical protein